MRFLKWILFITAIFFFSIAVIIPLNIYWQGEKFAETASSLDDLHLLYLEEPVSLPGGIGFINERWELYQLAKFGPLRIESRDGQGLGAEIPDEYRLRVKQLKIAMNRREFVEFPKLANLTTIQTVDSIDKHSYGELLANVAAPNLREIISSQGDVIHRIAEHASQIESLVVNNNAPGYEFDPNDLAKLTKLKVLVIPTAKVSAEHLNVVLILSDLETLRIFHTQENTADVTRFLRSGYFPKLRCLFINDLTSEQVKLIPEFSPNIIQIEAAGMERSDIDFLRKAIPRAKAVAMAGECRPEGGLIANRTGYGQAPYRVRYAFQGSNSSANPL